MENKLIEFFRVPDYRQNTDAFSWSLIFQHALMGLYFSVPFVLFFSPPGAIATGLFLSFISMMIAEVFGSRRSIYFLPRSRRIVARILVFPLIAVTVSVYGAEILEIKSSISWNSILPLLGLSILSLTALLVAIRQPNQNEGA